MRKCINNKNKDVSGEYMVMLPGSYILSYNAFPEILIKLEYFLAKRKIKKIANDIRKGNEKKLNKTGIFYKESSEPRLQDAIKSYAKIGQEFSVSEACISCETCIKVCPVNNIHLENGTITFGDNCQQCMACIQWCPKYAIDYKDIAKNRKRYHHKDITVKDMISI